MAKVRKKSVVGKDKKICPHIPELAAKHELLAAKLDTLVHCHNQQIGVVMQLTQKHDALAEAAEGADMMIADKVTSIAKSLEKAIRLVDAGLTKLISDASQSFKDVHDDMQQNYGLIVALRSDLDELAIEVRKPKGRVKKFKARGGSKLQGIS